MNIICLEGPHGSGKSTLVKQFQESGFETLDEGFLDMKEYSLHPQSLTMEVAWISSWFQSVLKMAHSMKDNLQEKPSLEKIFIADRSPYSAVYYASSGYLLKELIKTQIAEIQELSNVNIFTVYIKVEKELLWKRIQERLKVEPERIKYNEGSREWLEKTVNFYDKFEWDYVVENNEQTINVVKGEIIKTLSDQVDFQDYQETIFDSSFIRSPSEKDNKIFV
ncbi:thymidylate kinase [Anaeramoeba ignava]|uniref:Thymidylate kinase n=1 Tax=Anaeramoeba ignava TaxID=1746090 RepID=A0A9Q0LS06_ANAIG|nr:thymidylate kinase [Anaeramoeba ignava]